MKYDNSTIFKLQFDLSSYCNARCGVCARNVDGGDTVDWLPLMHFDVDLWERIVSKDLNGYYIHTLSLNGNWGDALMHPKLIEMLDFYQKYHPETLVEINTNASLRTSAWWAQLAKVLQTFPNGHRVIMGIDGLADTHHIYRRGTDFNKIMRNAKTFIGAGGTAVWIATAFDYNLHQLDEMRQLAYDMQFYAFKVRKSYGKTAEIITATEHYEITTANVPKDITRVYDLHIDRAPTRPDIIVETQQAASQCKWYADESLQIDPWGTVWPCCHTSMRGDQPNVGGMKIKFGVELEKFNKNNLHNHTLSEIFNNEYFTSILPKAVDDAAWGICRSVCNVKKIGNN